MGQVVDMGQGLPDHLFCNSPWLSASTGGFFLGGCVRDFRVGGHTITLG